MRDALHLDSAPAFAETLDPQVKGQLNIAVDD